MTPEEKRKKIEFARELCQSYGFSSDDLAIEDEAEVVEVEGGFCVEARIWVYDEE